MNFYPEAKSREKEVISDSAEMLADQDFMSLKQTVSFIPAALSTELNVHDWDILKLKLIRFAVEFHSTDRSGFCQPKVCLWGY